MEFISFHNSKRLSRVVILLIIPLLASNAYAEERNLSQDANPNLTTSRALSPVQINAIRTIGRHILVAKKSRSDDNTDQAELDNLRATLDQQMTADLNTASQFTPQAQENTDGRKLRTQDLGQRNTMIIQTKSLAQRLHTFSASRMSEDNQSETTSIKSAGLPIGKQRAEMFQKWARQLDEALTEVGANRLAKLQALRAQLESSDKQITEAHSHNYPPTIQAMPFDYVPMTTPDIVDKE